MMRLSSSEQLVSSGLDGEGKGGEGAVKKKPPHMQCKKKMWSTAYRSDLV
jgi:hypothetical protein